MTVTWEPTCLLRQRRIATGKQSRKVPQAGDFIVTIGGRTGPRMESTVQLLVV